MIDYSLIIKCSMNNKLGLNSLWNSGTWSVNRIRFPRGKLQVDRRGHEETVHTTNYSGRRPDDQGGT